MNASAPETTLASVGRPRIFVSFDQRHDEALRDRLSEEARLESSAFIVIGSSPAAGSNASAGLRQSIQRADQLIVICGQKSESCTEMAAELALAQEHNIPYFLIWGERGAMCTKPLGARPADAMYSWTREILELQVTALIRRGQADREKAARPAPAPASSQAPPRSRPPPMMPHRP